MMTDGGFQAYIPVETSLVICYFDGEDIKWALNVSPTSIMSDGCARDGLVHACRMAGGLWPAS